MFIIHDNETLSVTAAELIEAARAGKLAPSTPVSVDGVTWNRADEYEALNEAFNDCAIIDAAAMDLF